MMCIFGVMSKYKDSAVYIKSIEKYKYCYNIPVIKEEDLIETILKDDSLNLPKVKKIMQVGEDEEIIFYDCYFERELSESELKSLNKRLPISVYWTYETYKAQLFPNLKNYGFQQMKDPFTALWELEHWYDTHARPDEAIVPVGDDLTRLKAYGFDAKTSFRKSKEK